MNATPRDESLGSVLVALAANTAIAVGILFCEGDIVEHGEEAEEAAVEGASARGQPVAGSESLGIGSLRGAAR